jgi:hypothetical protein
MRSRRDLVDRGLSVVRPHIGSDRYRPIENRDTTVLQSPDEHPDTVMAVVDKADGFEDNAC